MVFRLGNDCSFPNPSFAADDEHGLLAVGGDLSAKQLLTAYSQGIFPWYPYRFSEICWYCPKRRFVIFPREIHVSHSMRTLMRKECYHVTYNMAFEQVIHNCGIADERNVNKYAWLGPHIEEAFIRLYRLGFGFSTEVWEGTRLVGGLYGVVIGKVYMGESMFSLVPSASKLALISLANVLAETDGTLIDCQFETPHLKSMGGRFIPYEKFMGIMRDGFNH